MIIVSDSGPLVYLVAIGIAECLPKLFGEVCIPSAVIAELRHPNCPASTWANELPDWVRVAAPKSILSEASLDVGERGAISLAIELRADLVLMDEKRGRKAAQAVGLKVAGTLAVIVLGARQELFDGRAALAKLALSNFYANPELLQQVYELLDAPADETP